MSEHIAVAKASRSTQDSALTSLLKTVFGEIKCGELLLELPSGRQLTFIGSGPGQKAHIQMHRWRLLRRIVTRGDIGFAEAYRDGDWSTPDLWSMLTWGVQNRGSSHASCGMQWLGRQWNSLVHGRRSNSRRNSRRNIAAHYDLGNQFYSKWLDGGMNYSSALYGDDRMSLEAAQSAKVDRVCELLDLKGGERVLEIGCGWGALAERLLTRHSCSVVGLTLSSQQREYAIARLASRGPHPSADIRYQDYRDTPERFDRIASIEMLEAVGEAYWATYFKTLYERLLPGGTAVIQTITISEDRFEKYRTRPDFIQLHIFPGGMLPTKTIVKRLAAEAGFTMESEEAFGRSYRKTLCEWRERFNASWKDISELGFDESFRRLWNYYLVYCQVGFESNSVDVCLYRFTRGLDCP